LKKGGEGGLGKVNLQQVGGIGRLGAWNAWSQGLEGPEEVLARIGLGQSGCFGWSSKEKGEGTRKCGTSVQLSLSPEFGYARCVQVGRKRGGGGGGGKKSGWVL